MRRRLAHEIFCSSALVAVAVEIAKSAMIGNVKKHVSMKDESPGETSLMLE
jgi:hypothetical protein